MKRSLGQEPYDMGVERSTTVLVSNDPLVGVMLEAKETPRQLSVAVIGGRSRVI